MPQAGAHASSASSWQSITRALRHRNYRLFFFGQGVSLIGTWMQRIALSWLVYRLTGSEFLLGTVGFCSQILTFLCAPFAGVIADRTSRRGLVIVTQTAAMLQAFLLAALTLTGTVQIWHIIVLSLLLGLINAFDIPIRQAFVVQMVETRQDLPNAIALNSFLVNGARLVGPSLAGILIALVGESTCFVLNGLSFMAVIAALFAMKVKATVFMHTEERVLQSLKEGFHYVAGSAPIRDILVLLALISLLGMPYMVIMPVFAHDILHGGPTTLGFLMAASGFGALLGALFLAAQEKIAILSRIIALASLVFGSSLVLFCCSRTLWLSLALLIVVGAGGMVQMASSNMLIQTIVDDDKRGRVMSFHTMAFMGMNPFGSLVIGALSSSLTAPVAMGLGAVGCIAAALVFTVRLPKLTKIMAPIFLRLGL